MHYRLSKASLDNREGIDERLIQASDYAIQRTVIDFGHPEYGGLRSTEDQQHLYSRIPRITHVDGIDQVSDHQSGYALDFFPYVNGGASYSVQHCALVVAAFLEGGSQLGLPLGWGGFWGNGPYSSGFTDMPHIYIPKAFR